MRQLASLLIAFTIGLLAAPAFAEDVVDYEPYSEMLGEYVDGQGRVAYEKWMNDDKDVERFKKFLKQVAEADLEGHSDQAKLAFWLNAYNARALHAVMSHWPMKGPMKVKGFFKVEPHGVAGKKMTLDQLEHQVIRQKFDEPRIHFVLVCAAKSCPRLRQKALTESNVESVMEAAAREFIPEVTKLAKKQEGDDGDEGEDPKIVTSKLFEWFAEDFKAAEGSVRAYLKKYVDEEGEVAEALADEDVEITFREYDWALNRQ